MNELKLMPLRYAGTCRTCGEALLAKTKAAYDPDTKTVLCLSCAGSEDGRLSTATPQALVPPIPQQASPASPGVAGESLQREYERRSAKREKNIREAHPRIGGFLLAVTNEPQSTRAFAQGAIGERKAADRLTELCGNSVLLLLNRKLGKGRRDGDIDVLAVTSAGVRVIDVKRYKDAAVAVRRTGGLFSPVREQLMIAGRDRSNLLESLNRQREAVQAALATFDSPVPIAVERGFCFVDANLPMFGTPTIDGVPLMGPKGTAASLNAATGVLDRETRDRIHRHLAETLPP
ncbi:MAG: hypothetical protein QOG52_546, partial [Frankiaceae bacterium]|nr:hypothetical protein [Frankiaceae bacterium]